MDGAAFYEHQGKPYHQQCYLKQIASRCAYCGKPLLSKYVKDSWGTKFCAEHTSEYPRCQFCGRLVPGRNQASSTAAPHQDRCLACKTSAIETVDQARPLFARLIQWINKEGLLYNNLDLRIKLCNPSQIASILGDTDKSKALGVTLHSTYKQNSNTIRTEVNGVAVLRGMPSSLFQSVTIHELGHAWLAVHKVLKLPSWTEEGFCELLSYRYLHDAATIESKFYAARIENNPDPTYGEGFRRVRAVAAATGFRTLVETLHTSKQLPTPKRSYKHATGLQ